MCLRFTTILLVGSKEGRIEEEKEWGKVKRNENVEEEKWAEWIKKYEYFFLYSVCGCWFWWCGGSLALAGLLGDVLFVFIIIILEYPAE